MASVSGIVLYPKSSLDLDIQLLKMSLPLLNMVLDFFQTLTEGIFLSPSGSQLLLLHHSLLHSWHITECGKDGTNSTSMEFLGICLETSSFQAFFTQAKLSLTNHSYSQRTSKQISETLSISSFAAPHCHPGCHPD